MLSVDDVTSPVVARQGGTGIHASGHGHVVIRVPWPEDKPEEKATAAAR
jgi:hypothetical protein